MAEIFTLRSRFWGLYRAIETRRRRRFRHPDNGR